MSQPDERSAYRAAQSSAAARSARSGPTLVPVHLEPDVDPLEGFTPEGTPVESDPLDAFGPVLADRFRDDFVVPASEPVPGARPRAWREPDSRRRGAQRFAVVSLLVLFGVAVAAWFSMQGSQGSRGRMAGAALREAVTERGPAAVRGVAALARAAVFRKNDGEAVAAATPPTNEPLPGGPDAAPVPESISPVPSTQTATPDAEADPLPARAGRGQVAITTDAKGARVFVDGRFVGTAPLTVRGVVAARHTITVSQGSKVANRTVDVAAGSVARVFLELAEPAARDATGSLTIQSPLPLRIVENGRTLGESSDTPLSVTAGRHELELVNDELELRVPLSVDIAAGRPTRLSVPLPTGRLSLNAVPWAEVFIDGRSLGLTPIANAQVPVGRHDLAWRHPQLGEKRSTVVVGAQAPARANMDLSR